MPQPEQSAALPVDFFDVSRQPGKRFDTIAQRLVDSGDLTGDDMLVARIAVEQQLKIGLARDAFASDGEPR